MNGNRLVRLVRTSHQEISLLPIREAYEWKLKTPRHQAYQKPCFQFVKRMNGNESHGIVWVGRHVGDLASNSWSVWMETIKPLYTCPNCRDYLLPIREAYEWKPSCIARSFLIGFSSCFQFVKRMNGNQTTQDHVAERFAPQILLPIREAYEWKHDITSLGKEWQPSCFQFVKRMNGNGCIVLDVLNISGLVLASNSWSVWMETPAR